MKTGKENRWKCKFTKGKNKIKIMWIRIKKIAYNKVKYWDEIEYKQNIIE